MGYFIYKGLNEGFATWIEYLAVDKCYPEFDIWTQFVADTFARFLVPDGLKSSHPIEVPIGRYSFLLLIFDIYIYIYLKVIRLKLMKYLIQFLIQKVHLSFVCYMIILVMMLFAKVFITI